MTCDSSLKEKARLKCQFLVSAKNMKKKIIVCFDRCFDYLTFRLMVQPFDRRVRVYFVKNGLWQLVHRPRTWRKIWPKSSPKQDPHSMNPYLNPVRC